MQRLRDNAGLTLIEVLSAVGLFSVVAVGITTSVVSNVKLNSRSRTTAAATALVQDRIEQIRMIVPITNTVPAELTAGSYSDANNPLTPLGDANGIFTRTWTVAGVPQYLNGTVVGNRPGIVQVAVKVSWSGPLAGSMTAVTYACTTPTCG